MKISKFDVYPLSIPYRHREVSSIIDRGGVSGVVIRIEADNGLVGWGECCAPGDTSSVVAAARAAAPFVLGRDPWSTEAIAREYYGAGGWQFQAMTGNFAFAGVDIALWDLCGKQCGQPIYRLFGGAQRDVVDYFFYLHWDDDAGMEAQGRDGVVRGHSAFYMKVGVDERREEEMLAAVRRAIGPDRKIRIDVNQSWTVNQAARIIRRWDDRYDLDFVEAPVPIDPVENMVELKRLVRPALCVNEGLWREADAHRLVRARCADIVCLSQYWVGSMRRLQSFLRAAHLEGMRFCKHTHGEYGIAAAAGQHMLIAAPNGGDGHQQTAQLMEDDILVEEVPIASRATWGLIERPGLGIEVDEDKVRGYHERFRREVEYLPFGDVGRDRSNR